MEPLFGFRKMWLLLAIPLVLCCLLASEQGVLAAGTPAGTNISNTATTTYQDANSNNYTANSNTVSVTVNAVYSVSVTCAANLNANSNTTAYYACTVTNTGNASNTFTLSDSTASGWTLALLADDGAGSGGVANDGIHQSGENTVTASTGAVVADATYKFFLAVTVPAGTANGTTAAATVTATGIDGSGDTSSQSRTTTAQAPALQVQKKVRNVTTSGSFAASGVTAKPNETLEYQVQVTNAGAITAMNVTLQDTLDPNVTYVTNSLWAGSNPSTNNGTGNSQKTDAASGDGTCVGDSCAAANFNSGTSKVTFYLGNGATESAGGSLNTSSTVYVYYRVLVK